MRFFSSYFWGVFLIFVGAVYLLKANYNLNIPVFRLAVGFILVFLGLSIMFGGFGWRGNGDIFFDSGEIRADEDRSEYNLVFSDATLDLTGLQTGTARKIEVHNIFANGTLVLDASRPAAVKVNAVFAAATLPDDRTINFGDAVYRTEAAAAGADGLLEIKVDVIFGRLGIVAK